MLVCMLSAYVNSFFMSAYGADEMIAAIEITPVCEELIKLLPLLFYFLMSLLYSVGGIPYALLNCAVNLLWLS